MATTGRSKRKAQDVEKDDDFATKDSKRRRPVEKAAKKKSGFDDDDGFVFKRPASSGPSAPATNGAVVETRQQPPVNPFPPPALPTAPRYPSTVNERRRPTTPDRSLPASFLRPAGMDSIVALPLSDTPVIRKNQDLRQQGGRRRSSLGMRGKRASSMGNGFVALPHPEIPYEDFHKHISVDLPEPLRMKQLLAWCSRRALDEQKAKERPADSSSGAIARAIAEEVLKDLIDNKINTSWYSREDDAATISPIKKKPHPTNIENLRKIKECEQKLARLKGEQQAWATLVPDQPSDHPQAAPAEREIHPVDAEEAEFLASLDAQQATDAEMRKWLGTAESELEFQVDRFFHSLHSIKMFGETADGYGGRLLQQAAEALDKRDQKAKKAVGTMGVDTMDVLRSVARGDNQ
ncbi:hypothetical protein SAICODRAFT_30561 [Saitoella complicata NRRL Y-17804]|nr:uncharacterized protein SAICODRAFT_30561 [Saitoella complicata NRRL Y-17804]ODQ52766.1 hypothetical protein SAICODRAFT_30561 [Saitoella complicata NRRL Y-17804]